MHLPGPAGCIQLCVCVRHCWHFSRSVRLLLLQIGATFVWFGLFVHETHTECFFLSFWSDICFESILGSWQCVTRQRWWWRPIIVSRLRKGKRQHRQPDFGSIVCSVNGPHTNVQTNSIFYGFGAIESNAICCPLVRSRTVCLYWDYIEHCLIRWFVLYFY